MKAFDFEELAALESDAELAIYRALTLDQVIGLLDVCGNYFARRPDFGPEEIPFSTGGADAVHAHRDLVHSYRRIAEGDRSLNRDHDPLVFTDREQQSLRLHKYVRGCERITRAQLLDLLRAVHAYSLVGTDIPLRPNDGVLGKVLNRYFHAHNWLLRFGREPFTDEEFVDDLRETILLRRNERSCC